VKIVTLVPAFKVKYFEQLLVSLKSQTTKPCKIIVSDDSPQGDFVAAIESKKLAPIARDLPIDVIRGPQKGHYHNYLSLLEKVPGEASYFQILCDDDILYPDFYQRHLEAHSQMPTLFSSSKRWVAAESGQPVGGPRIPGGIDKMSSRVVKLDGKSLARSIIPKCSNWLGEFSNVVFAREAIPYFYTPHLSGIPYFGLYDIGTLLQCAEQKSPIYINEALGAFRRSGQQHTSQTAGPVFKSGIIGWLALSSGAYRRGWISADELMSCGRFVLDFVARKYSDDSAMVEVLNLRSAILAGDAENHIAGVKEMWPQFLRHIDPALMVIPER
jgi:hypothetical protein